MVEKILVHEPTDEGERVSGWIVAPGSRDREESVCPRKEAFDDDTKRGVDSIEELSLGNLTQCTLVLEHAMWNTYEPEIGQQCLV